MKPRIGVTSCPTIREDRLVEEINRSYVRAVLRSGGLPLILPVLTPSDVDDVLEGLDGILLTGGGDVDPGRYGQLAVAEVDGVDDERDDWELALAREVFIRDMPVLGICRGSQVLNVALGGTLVQHLPDVSSQSHHERHRFAEEIHRVDLVQGSRVALAMDRAQVGVNTLHHQAVKQVGAGLRVVGLGDDGIVEAIEAIDGTRAIGVQWHPELLTDLPGHRELFEWLVDEASSHFDRPAVEAVA
jgi:putative glutamine amidotransferase